MIEHDLSKFRRAEILPQDAGADLRVALQFLPFPLCEYAVFIQDLIGDGGHADVVQETEPPEKSAFAGIRAQPAAEFFGHSGDADAVAVQLGIALKKRLHDGLDGAVLKSGSMLLFAGVHHVFSSGNDGAQHIFQPQARGCPPRKAQVHAGEGVLSELCAAGLRISAALAKSVLGMSTTSSSPPTRQTKSVARAFFAGSGP